jgi:hypothetical protein
VPEVKAEGAVEKTYKISFGAMVGRCDIAKDMYIDGLQYLNLSYPNLVMIEAVGKQVLDTALPELREALLKMGFSMVESTGTEEEKAQLRTLAKPK